jgi:hypothetical protein
MYKVLSMHVERSSTTPDDVSRALAGVTGQIISPISSPLRPSPHARNLSGAFASVNADSDAPLVAPRAFHPVVAPSSSVSFREDRGDIYVSAKFLGADDDALVRVLINANVGSSVSVSADGFPDTLVPLSALVSLQIPALTKVDLVEEIDDDETNLERLYVIMQEGKKVLWTRAQLKKLQSEDRCFKCAQKGHRAPECQNPPANPKTIRFTNLLEVTSYDTEDAALFFALHKLNDIDERAGNGTVSQ